MATKTTNVQTTKTQAQNTQQAKAPNAPPAVTYVANPAKAMPHPQNSRNANSLAACHAYIKKHGPQTKASLVANVLAKQTPPHKCFANYSINKTHSLVPAT